MTEEPAATPEPEPWQGWLRFDVQVALSGSDPDVYADDVGDYFEQLIFEMIYNAEGQGRVFFTGDVIHVSAPRQMQKWRPTLKLVSETPSHSDT
jgi:hypothetical protein